MQYRKYNLDDQMYDGSNVWLIKPRDFNRGRGVKLFNNLEQLNNLIREFTQVSYNKELYYLTVLASQTISTHTKNFNHFAASKMPGEEP